MLRVRAHWSLSGGGAIGGRAISAPSHTELVAAAVLAATCFGCKTAVKLDVVAQPGGNDGVYEVVPTGVTDQSRANALIVKRQERAGCFPLVFFRCFDDEGLTVRVAETAVIQLAEATKDASVAMWAMVPPGAKRVEVTAICDQMPAAQPGDPQPKADN